MLIVIAWNLSPSEFRKFHSDVRALRTRCKIINRTNPHIRGKMVQVKGHRIKASVLAKRIPKHWAAVAKIAVTSQPRQRGQRSQLTGRPVPRESLKPVLALA